MLLGAGGGEGAGDGEEDDLLVGPALRGREGLGDAAGGYAGFFFGVWDVAVEEGIQSVRYPSAVEESQQGGAMVVWVETCPKNTPSGKESPTLGADMMGGGSDSMLGRR